MRVVTNEMEGLEAERVASVTSPCDSSLGVQRGHYLSPCQWGGTWLRGSLAGGGVGRRATLLLTLRLLREYGKEVVSRFDELRNHQIRDLYRVGSLQQGRAPSRPSSVSLRLTNFRGAMTARSAAGARTAREICLDASLSSRHIDDIFLPVCFTIKLTLVSWKSTWTKTSAWRGVAWRVLTGTAGRGVLKAACR